MEEWRELLCSELDPQTAFPDVLCTEPQQQLSGRLQAGKRLLRVGTRKAGSVPWFSSLPHPFLSSNVHQQNSLSVSEESQRPSGSLLGSKEKTCFP